MQRRILAVGIASLVVGIAIGVVAAQPGCVAADAACVRLPIIRAAGASCEATAPPGLGAKPQAWMTRYTVTSGEPLAACAFSPSSLSSFYVIIRQSGLDLQSEPVARDAQGRATIAIPTTMLAPNELIAVEVILQPGTGSPTRIDSPLFVWVRVGPLATAEPAEPTAAPVPAPTVTRVLTLPTLTPGGPTAAPALPTVASEAPTAAP